MLQYYILFNMYHIYKLINNIIYNVKIHKNALKVVKIN